jgi:Kef-type K+ transport system membrane component KefB
MFVDWTAVKLSWECRILALAGAYFKQPRVIFEVIGGILLGPSAIGRNSEYLQRIFSPNSLGYIGLVANFGIFYFALPNQFIYSLNRIA